MDATCRVLIKCWRDRKPIFPMKGVEDGKGLLKIEVYP
jgi:hypothetical protein